MKRDKSWSPGEIDFAWIESLGAADPSRPSPPSSGPRRRAASRSSTAKPGGSSRRSSPTGGGSCEVGTAIGYSTLWMALGQPADGTIVTIDPDASRTDVAREHWRSGGDRRRAGSGS